MDMPQVIQRLHDEQLNSAELLAELGFSARVMDEGFNKHHLMPRQASPLEC
jgi:hypothetical protein